MVGRTFSDDELSEVVRMNPTFGDYKLAGLLAEPGSTQQEKRRIASQLFRWRKRTGHATSRPPALHVVPPPVDGATRPPPKTMAELTPIERLRKDIEWTREHLRMAATDRSHTAVTGMMALVRKMEADLEGRLAAESSVDVQVVTMERLKALVEQLPRSLLLQAVGGGE